MRSHLAWCDYLLVAWRALLDHRLRSLLTMLGVIVGVASAIRVARKEPIEALRYE
ncbi:MAG: hypothetical protein RMM08_04265 [Armatimonadota bacterium]|nr:hypothetical protein [bacterium]MDW8320558.1 hypothetical protein [Armatimonadota bacterium]